MTITAMTVLVCLRMRVAPEGGETEEVGNNASFIACQSGHENDCNLSELSAKRQKAIWPASRNHPHGRYLGMRGA